MRDDMIADGRALDVLVAEDAGRIVGYASYQDHYDTDVGARGLWLAELYVAEEARRRGVARRLLAALARIAAKRGLVSIGWAVRTANRRARDFYEIIGAGDDDTRLIALDGSALASLAERADDIEDVSLALERLKNPGKRWTQDGLENGLDLED
ncbi:MAG: GNAT family N-acetyltransferase [Alphaproteobacteria bacterium]